MFGSLLSVRDFVLCYLQTLSPPSFFISLSQSSLLFVFSICVSKKTYVFFVLLGRNSLPLVPLGSLHEEWEYRAEAKYIDELNPKKNSS